jgi:hypothetical protein
MLVEQAIVDATGRAMVQNRLGATAGDLAAAVLRSSVLSVRAPLDVPLSSVMQCADRAAAARHQITDIADVLQCVLVGCADALAAQPAGKAAIESALAEAVARPRFSSTMDECRATFWRVETTRASGRRQNQYFTTLAQAERQRAGLPPTGDGIQISAHGVTDEDENDPVEATRIVPPAPTRRRRLHRAWAPRPGRSRSGQKRVSRRGRPRCADARGQRPVAPPALSHQVVQIRCPAWLIR